MCVNALYIVNKETNWIEFSLLMMHLGYKMAQGGTPLNGPYRYVRPQKITVFRRFGHKQGVDFS